MNYPDLIQLYFERSTAMQAVLEPLRGYRWRTARIFFITQTTGRDHDVDRVDSVRPVCL